MSRIRTYCLTALLLAPLAGCGGGDQAPPASIESPAQAAEVAATTPAPLPSTPQPSSPAPAARTKVRLTTSMGEVVVELFDDRAPATVMNFLKTYVEPGFYNGTLLHYVNDKMIIGGGFTAAGQPKQTAGWIRNESDNGLSNRRGTIAMARDPEYPDSASSQFFFNLQDNLEFDHRSDLESADVGGNGYCVFGEVISGLDVLQKIAQVPVADGQFASSPVQPVTVQSVTTMQ